MAECCRLLPSISMSSLFSPSECFRKAEDPREFSYPHYPYHPWSSLKSSSTFSRPSPGNFRSGVVGNGCANQNFLAPPLADNHDLAPRTVILPTGRTAFRELRPAVELRHVACTAGGQAAPFQIHRAATPSPRNFQIRFDRARSRPTRQMDSMGDFKIA